MDKLNLLPCPFCGEETVHVHDSYCAGNGFMVLCGSCTAEGPLCNTEAEAATEWNRRAAPSSSADELPALPEMPRAVLEHPNLGDLFGRFKMHQYAVAYADLAIAADRRARQGEPVTETIMANGMPVERAQMDWVCRFISENSVFDGDDILQAWNALVAFYVTNRAAIQAAAPADAPTHPPRVTPEMLESLNAANRLLEEARVAREERQARLEIAVEDAREQQPAGAKEEGKED